MARLRNIDGVTRVSLAKSEKAETGAAGRRRRLAVRPRDRQHDGRPPAAALRQRPRPQFEMVMFFEGDAEAAHRARAPPRPPGAPARPAAADARRATPRRRHAGRRRHVGPGQRLDPRRGHPDDPREGSRRDQEPEAPDRHRRGRGGDRRLLDAGPLAQARASSPSSTRSRHRPDRAQPGAGRRWRPTRRPRARTRANYATVVRLGKAVPADDDVRSLIVQLDSAAERSNVDFAASRSAARPPPAATPRSRPAPRPRPRARSASAPPASPPCRSSSPSTATSTTCRRSSPGSSAS